MARKTVQFDKLNKKQKRIAIAKDVLKQLASSKRQLIPTTGVYFEGPGYSYLGTVGEVRNARKCYVCALGACFVSKLKLSAPRNTSESPTMWKDLENIFSSAQMGKIEAAFEGWTQYPAVTGKTPKARMKQIFQNIVKNDGTFKPGARA